MQRAVIIIPTYNERDTIEKTIQKLDTILASLDNWEMQVLVVDDTSPDKTYELVESLSESYEWLSLLINAEKGGLGGAYLKGMAHAFGEMNADIVFEFDADLSHDPDKLTEFLSKIDDGADMVLGTRYTDGGAIPDDWGLHRKFLSIVGNLFMRALFFEYRVTDWTTGYRAITKEVYESVAPSLDSERFHGYTFQIGFLHRALLNGFSVTEVPFVFVDREAGESKLGPEYIKNTLIYIIRTRILDLLHSAFFKVALVGGVGALVQLTALSFLRPVIGDDATIFSMTMPGGLSDFIFSGYQLAFVLSVELAIISNFILNNMWTFAENAITLADIPNKFAQFNLASMGSLVIQYITAVIGEGTIGLLPILTLPIIGLTIDTGMVYAVLGILMGLFWNFFAYTKLIWRT